MNACSSSGVIANFGLGTVVVGGAGGNGTNIGVMTLMVGGDVSYLLLRNLLISMFMVRGIHPSVPMGMVDEDVLGNICFQKYMFLKMNVKNSQ